MRLSSQPCTCDGNCHRGNYFRIHFFFKTSCYTYISSINVIPKYSFSFRLKCEATRSSNSRDRSLGCWRNQHHAVHFSSDFPLIMKISPSSSMPMWEKNRSEAGLACLKACPLIPPPLVAIVRDTTSSNISYSFSPKLHSLHYQAGKSGSKYKASIYF